MKAILIDSIMNNIVKYYSYSEFELNKIRYGIETLYMTITKGIVITFIAALLAILKEYLLFLIFYSIIRIPAFGAHAKKSIHCWMSSIVTFLLIPILIKYVSLDKNVILLICFVSILIFCIYAPADTEKRPLNNRKKRIINKVITLFISYIYLFYIILVDNPYFHNVLMYSLFLEALLVLPITYKLFGIKYKNYKNYVKGGLKWNYLLL